MPQWLSSLLVALVMTGIVASVEPAQAQVSIRIGPPPSSYPYWVPERRYWNGRRYVHVPGRWERRQARRELRRELRHEQRREYWRERRRWEERQWEPR